MPDDDRWQPMPPRGGRRQRHEPVSSQYGENHNGYDHRYAQADGAALPPRDPYRQPEYAPRLPRTAAAAPDPARVGPPGRRAHGRAAVPGPGNTPGRDSIPDRDPVRPGSARRGARRRRRGRRTLAVVVTIVILVLGGLTAVTAGMLYLAGSTDGRASAAGEPTAGPSPSPSPTLEPLPFSPAEISPASVGTTGFLSWAVMDRRTGEIFGSENLAATSTTASMIKPAIAADYLRRLHEKGQRPTASRLRDLEAMIVVSDNDAAQRIYSAAGGRAAIDRIIATCALTDSRSDSYGWSKTHVSAQDTVRLGQCLADGRAAGPEWTQWIIDRMREVRAEGDFGPRKIFPPAVQATIAIKNGWFPRADEDRNWHVGCLAIGDTWIMSVLQRYPMTAGWDPDFAHVQQVCADVAKALLNPDTG